MQSIISYPADENYTTNNNYESGALKYICQRRRVLSLYVFSKNAALTYLKVMDAKQITAVAIADDGAGVATATTTTPHGLNDGDSVTVSGSGTAQENITATITVLSPTRFKYTIAATGGAHNDGACTVTYASTKAKVYPIGAGSYVNVVVPGGVRMEKGLGLALYSDSALTTLVNTSDFNIDVNFSAYV